MLLVNVDPGVQAAGVAVFEDGELSSAWLSRGDGWRATALAVCADLLCRYPLDILGGVEVAVEVPQVYHQSKLKGDPNDLVDLTLMAGAFAGYMEHQRCGAITTYRPREWKGQVPKDVMIERIKNKLSKDELKRIELPAKSLQHNVYDAVGIGLYHESKVRR